MNIPFLQGHSHRRKEPESPSVQGVYLEAINDAMVSGGVIAAAIIMITTKYFLADPLISIGLAFFYNSTNLVTHEKV